MNTKYTFIKTGLLQAIAMTLFAISGSAQQANTYQQFINNGGGKLNIHYYSEPLFAYNNTEGELTGIAIDVLNIFLSYVEKTEHISIEPNFIKHTEFPDFYNTVKNSESAIIGVGSTTITTERRQEIDFSPPFFINKAVLLTNNQVKPADHASELGELLAGKTMFIYKGTTQENYAGHIKSNLQSNIMVEYVDSDRAVLNAIVKNPNHFGCVDLPVLIQALKEGLPLVYQSKADIKGENFAFITPSNSGWKQKLEEFFELGYGFKSSDLFKNIVYKHLGSDLNTFLRLAASQKAKN